MIKWILSLALISDCIYQLYGNPYSVNWMIYYDLAHNLFVFSVAMWAALKVYEMRTISYVFIMYYFIISANEVCYIGTTQQEYFRGHSGGILQGWSYLALTLLVIFVIIKKWNIKTQWKN